MLIVIPIVLIIISLILLFKGNKKDEFLKKLYDLRQYPDLIVQADAAIDFLASCQWEKWGLFNRILIDVNDNLILEIYEYNYSVKIIFDKEGKMSTRVCFVKDKS